MADASFIQTSFLGGEWAPYVQGRADDPKYRTGLNVCRNSLPVEEGAWTRRPGIRMTVATRKGLPGALRSFDFRANAPYNLELTDGHMRLHNGPSLVLESLGRNLVASISAASPGVITTELPHTWSTGDAVQFIQDPSATVPNYTLDVLFGRECEITVLSTTTFSVIDQLTRENIDCTSVVLGSSSLFVGRVADFATPYINGSWATVNTCQDDANLLLLNAAYAPRVVTNTVTPRQDQFGVFSIGAATLNDGPYMDPPIDGTTITASAKTGSVNLTLAGGSTRWTLVTDIGRLVRLFSEPAAWAAATTYAAGTQVKFNNDYYVSLTSSNTGHAPDSDVINWAIDTTAAAWTWAKITATTSVTVAVATIMGPDLLRTTACATWRLGLYSDTSGWPTAGVFHEGRFWLTSATFGNRIDGCVSNGAVNGVLNFSPTSFDGTVSDDNACAYVFKSDEVNSIFWLNSDEKGIICGTQGGEWLIRASDSNDILTPTSVQAKRVTKYGCANVQAKRLGMAVAFVNRSGRQLMEYVTSDYRGFSGRNLSISGKQLTKSGLKEIAFVRELTPVLWARTGDGGLIGCTYKRESPYASDPPDFSGWHRHDLGSGFTVESLQSGPSMDGTLDALSMVVKDPATGFRYVHLMTDIFDQNNVIGDAYFVDSGQSPAMIQLDTSVNPDVLRLYSLWRLRGKTISVFIGGVDAGDFVVGTNGRVEVPIDNGGLLTSAQLAAIQGTTTNFHNTGIGLQVLAAGSGNTPTVTGLSAFLAPNDPSTNHKITAIDWDNFRVYSSTRPTAFTSVVNVFDIRTQAAVISALPDPTSNATDDSLIYGDGKLYASGGGTGTGIFQLDATTLSILQTFGTITSPASATHVSPVGDWCLLPYSQGDHYIVISSRFSNEIAFFRPLPISWGGTNYTTTEGAAVCCNANRHDAPRAVASAWVIGTPVTNPSRSTSLYKLVVSPLASSFTTKQTIPAASVDASWTHISAVSIVFLDETDLNVIALFREGALAAFSSGTTYAVGAMVSSSGRDYQSRVASNVGNTPASSPTQWLDLGVSGPVQSRLLKLNPYSGSVLWSINVGLDAGFTFGPIGFGAGIRVKNGHLAWIESTNGSGSANNVLHNINTLTGADVTSTLHGISPDTCQYYNDVYGQLIFNTFYDNFSGTYPGAPTNISPTPANFNFKLATLGPAPGPAFPAALPPSAAVIDIVPVAIGYTYTSQGQILRAIAPQEAGAQNGPALGKTRRSHMFSALLQGTQGIKFGTILGATRTAQLRSKGNVPFPLTTLFSGVHWDTLDDDYSFDSMVCWEITRPYPAAICTLGAFLHTQDR